MIIGLTGRAGSGKSTLAHMLYCGQGFARVSFAEPLKDMLLALGCEHAWLYGSQEDKSAPRALLGGKSARYAMQTLGTEWGRELISSTLWIDAWVRRVQKAQRKCPRVVADDVRFANEAAAIKRLGGIVVRIERGETAGSPEHASEDIDAIPHDAVIHNTGRIGNMGWQICSILSKA